MNRLMLAGAAAALLAAPFAVAQNLPSSTSAQQRLTDLGMTVIGDPVLHKKHSEFQVQARSGTMYVASVDLNGEIELEVGQLRAAPPPPPLRGDASFGPAEARRFADAAGYRVISEPQPEKKHFVASVQRGDGPAMRVDIHRDGRIVTRDERAGLDLARAELRTPPSGSTAASPAPMGMTPSSPNGEIEKVVFGPAEARAEVEQRGYRVTGEPRAEKRHFVIDAIGQDGRPVLLHAHRDGRVIIPRT